MKSALAATWVAWFVVPGLVAAPLHAQRPTPEEFIRRYLATERGSPWSRAFAGGCDDPWFQELRGLTLALPIPPLDSPKRGVGVQTVLSSAARCEDDSATRAWVLEHFGELTRQEKGKAVFYAARHGAYDLIDAFAPKIRSLAVDEQEAAVAELLHLDATLDVEHAMECFFRLWDAGVMPPRFARTFSRYLSGFEPTSVDFVSRVVGRVDADPRRVSAVEVLEGALAQLHPVGGPDRATMLLQRRNLAKEVRRSGGGS